jgi:hypothetical protein
VGTCKVVVAILKEKDSFSFKTQQLPYKYPSPGATFSLKKLHFVQFRGARGLLCGPGLAGTHLSYT